MRLEQYLTEAKKKAGSAETFEEYIVEAWNILLDNPNAEERFISAIFSTDEHQVHAPAAFKVAKYSLRVTNSKSKMLHSGFDNGSLSPFYVEHGGVNNTSKADIRTADSKYRLSLKENKKSQLISGGRTDVYPIFKIAEKNFSGTSESLDLIEQAFGEILSKIKPPKSAKEFIDVKHMKTVASSKEKMGMLDAAHDPEFRKTLPADVNAFLDQITFADKHMKQGLNQKINDIFNKSDVFKRMFTYEAASGDGKFLDRFPVANGFLIFSGQSGKAVVEMFEDYNSNAIKDLSKSLSFRFRWKHGSKVVLAGDIPSKEKLYDSVTYETMLYDELNEGIVDVFKNFAGWLKKFIGKMISFVKDLAKKGIDHVYNFFGMEITGVQVSW